MADELVPVINFKYDPMKLSELSKDELRDLIADLESQLSKLPQTEIPVEHHFSKDVYAREMRAAKGTILVGKIHKYQNLNIMSKGDVTVLSIDGVQRVRAPHTFVASPGAKRLFLVHEDSVWTTIHGTSLTNIDEIETEFIAKSYDEVITLNENIKLEGEVCLG